MCASGSYIVLFENKGGHVTFPSLLFCGDKISNSLCPIPSMGNCTHVHYILRQK